ncbi:hypothetical protein ACI2KV_25080 [Micromonospora chokoriensis]
MGILIHGTVVMEFDDRPTLTIHGGQPFLMLSTYFVNENEPLVTQCH